MPTLSKAVFSQPVDLLVLIILCAHDFKILGKDTQIHQSRDIFSLFQDIFLFAVVTLDFSGQRNRSCCVAFVTAVALHGVLDGFCVCYHQRLAITAFQLVCDHIQQFLTGYIPVECFVVFQ